MSSLTEVLDKFFAHPQRRVLALKGKWGVGKTFAWRKYAEGLRDVQESAISYVSLFGASSLTEVKRLILEKAVPLHAKNFTRGIKLLQRSLAFGKYLPKVSDFSNAAQYLAELLLKNFIVCFDDIERRSPSLQLASVLGLISLLKEENQCRIVLIFNENEMSKNDLEDLKKYREKIIDLEYTYAPTIEDNAALIFKDQKYPFVLEVFTRLETSNIRVMQQTAWNLDYFEPFTDGLLASTRLAFLSKVALLTCLFGTHGEDVDFGSLHKISFGSFILAKGGEDETNPQERLLHKIGYIFSESDEFIISYLQHGSTDENKLTEALRRLDADERKNRIRQQLIDIWNSFTANFQTDEARFAAQATSFLDKHASDIAWSELIELCAVLQEFQPELDVEKWKDAFLEPRIQKLGLGDIETFRSLIKNPGLLAELEARREQLLKSGSIKDMIYRIVEARSWSPEDIAALNAFAEADYRAWIENENAPTLMHILEKLLALCQSMPPDSPERAVNVKLVNALKHIAEASTINRLRVERVLRIDLGQR